MMANLKKIIYLTEAQKNTLFTEGSVTSNGRTITYNQDDIYITPDTGVEDIQIGGSSVVSNGVATIPMASTSAAGLLSATDKTKLDDLVVIGDIRINGSSIVSNRIATIPIASDSTYGVVKVNEDYGTAILNNTLVAIGAGNNRFKNGNDRAALVAANTQHIATYYGLSKLAGVDLASETVTVGTYPDTSKAAIQNLLGITSLFAPSEVSTATAAHAANSLFMMDGKLNRATSAIAIGDAVEIGTNCEVTSIEESFAKKIEIPFEYSIYSGAIQSKAYTINSTLYTQTASGFGSFAVGCGSTASGSRSFAEGQSTTASSQNAHAEGGFTVAAGKDSHSSGYYTYATHHAQFVFGQYNVVDPSTAAAGENGNYIEIVGNGSDANNHSNARALTWTGDERLNGYLYVGCNADSTGGVRVPHDVQVNGTSVVNNGVANVQIASDNPGVVRASTNLGVGLTSAGYLAINGATSGVIKTGTAEIYPLTPGKQHESTFYGLAKAAGDTTQSASSNAVGTYTAEAKASIHTMLGIDLQSIASEVEIPLVETISSTTPSITGQPNVRYVCGEVSTITITPPASGSMDVIFESGSTATVLTIPNTVKWPAWFDATALETDTTYEILITDGVYGSVMTWAT